MRGLSGENGLAEDIVESIKQKDQARLYKVFTVCYVKDLDLVIFAKKIDLGLKWKVGGCSDKFSSADFGWNSL